MPSLFGFGAPQFDLDDAKIAIWNGDGTYGTALDVPSVQIVGGAIQNRQGTLSGDGYITATAAKIQAAQVQFRFGGLSQEVLEIVTGKAVESSGTTPNRIKYTRWGGGQPMPYFSLCARTLAAEGTGDTHIFFPKLKAMDGFEIRFEEEAFSIPEISCMSLPDSNWTTGGRPLLAVLVEHETAVAVVIPPANIPQT